MDTVNPAKPAVVIHSNGMNVQSGTATFDRAKLAGMQSAVTSLATFQWTREDCVKPAAIIAVEIMRAHAGHDFQLDTARHFNPVDEVVYLPVIHDQGCNPVDEVMYPPVIHDQGVTLWMRSCILQ